MQAASILMAYVFAHTPDPEPHQTPLTAYAMTSVMGIVLSAVFWLIRMNDVRLAKRARPRFAHAVEAMLLDPLADPPHRG
jgi:hypothetical protein